MRVLAVVCLLVLVSTAQAAQKLRDISIEEPQGWRLHQEGESEGTLLMGFENGEEYVRFYTKADTSFSVKDMFESSVTVGATQTEIYGPFNWEIIEAHRPATADEAPESFIATFRATHANAVYYGYSASTSAAKARANITAFLDKVIVTSPIITGRSLTTASFTGKKYYYGWGAAGGGDPAMMHNEVKYDVLHTHDIFTKEVGGNYIGTKQTGKVSASQIRAEWQRLGNLIGSDDMYVQYSSGHGSPSGLGVGVSYRDIRDNALKMKAKEIIIFIMACHSGGLVDAFDQKKNEWKDWDKQGRTLMVLASSKKSQTSSTGPGKDEDEPGGPTGSAGSAFGHALWKALIGYADGYKDGVKDGFLNLQEIRDFSVWKTQKVGGHTPVHTGVYNGQLVMNRVPPKAWVEALERSTEGLSDDQIAEKIRELDSSLRVGN